AGWSASLSSSSSLVSAWGLWAAFMACTKAEMIWPKAVLALSAEGLDAGRLRPGHGYADRPRPGRRPRPRRPSWRSWPWSSRCRRWRGRRWWWWWWRGGGGGGGAAGARGGGGGGAAAGARGGCTGGRGAAGASGAGGG